MQRFPRVGFILPLSIFFTLTLVFGGCDRSDEPLAASNEAAAAHLNLSLVAPLLSGHRTHFTVDPNGSLYWSQESDDSQDRLDTISPGGVLTASSLTSQKILAAMGFAAGRGNIQSLLYGPGDHLYFYFAGGQGNHILDALGAFDLQTQQVRLLATTVSLQQATGMGDALDLARGTLLRRTPAPGQEADEENTLYLWLRHSDAGLVLRFDASAALTSGNAAFKLAFSSLRGGPPNLKLTSDDDDLVPGPRGTLLYLDRAQAMLWRLELPPAPRSIDSKSEDALDRPAVVAREKSLLRIPSSLTAPALGLNGELMFLVGAGPVMRRASTDLDVDAALPARTATSPGDWPAPPTESTSSIARDLRDSQILTAAQWPGMLILSGVEIRILGRDVFKLPLNLQSESFQPTGLLSDQTPYTWITFDRASGSLLRVKMQDK